MDPLMNLAEKHGFAVLEDTAEAHRATHQGRNEPDSAFMRDAMPRLFARTPVARSRSGSVLSLEHRTRACASISLPIHVAKLAP
jgi:dTDP-4-amino-4,6-dideoxygalactose transaminase